MTRTLHLLVALVLGFVLVAAAAPASAAEETTPADGSGATEHDPDPGEKLPCIETPDKKCQMSLGDP